MKPPPKKDEKIPKNKRETELLSNPKARFFLRSFRFTPTLARVCFDRFKAPITGNKIKTIHIVSLEHREDLLSK